MTWDIEFLEEAEKDMIFIIRKGNLYEKGI